MLLKIVKIMSVMKINIGKTYCKYFRVNLFSQIKNSLHKNIIVSVINLDRHSKINIHYVNETLDYYHCIFMQKKYTNANHL